MLYFFVFMSISTSGVFKRTFPQAYSRVLFSGTVYTRTLDFRSTQGCTLPGDFAHSKIRLRWI